MNDERPMVGRSLVFAPNAATRPWVACAAMGLIALALILGGVGLLGEDINWLVKAMPFVGGVGAAVLAADVWRTRPAATATELEQTQKAIAGLRQDLVALKDTFQQMTVPLLPQGPSPETAVGMVRALLVQTDTALSNKFTEVSKKMDSVGMDIARIVGVVQGAVLGEMNRLLQQIESSRTEGRDELTLRLDKLSAVMDDLTALSGQTAKYDPGLVKTIADRVANLEGIGSGTLTVLDKLEADLGRLTEIEQTLSTVHDTQQNMIEELKKITLFPPGPPPPTPPPTPPPPPPSVSLREQFERLSKCYQVEEKTVGTFAMAPFWLAYASVFPKAIRRLSDQAGDLDPALGPIWDDALLTSRDILDTAAVELEKPDYMKNISRMWASFDKGPSPRDQTEELVEGVVQEFSGVLRGQQQRLTGEVRQVASSLGALRSRLGTALAFVLPVASFDILDRYRPGPESGTGKELAWVLMGRAMAAYVDKHYGQRLLRP